MKLEQIAPSKLKPAGYNPRRIGEDQLKRLAKLIDAHGFVSPVIARAEDYLILGGHQRIKALKHTTTKIDTVPVILLTGISDDKAKALTIALNNTSAQGVYDLDMLGILIKEIDCLEIAEITGFSLEQIEDFKVDMSEIDISGFVSMDEPSANSNELEIEQGGCIYILSGDAEMFSKSLLSDIRKLVCPEGIAIKKG